MLDSSHSSRGREVLVVVSDGCVLGSYDLSDWHIQTLILMFLLQYEIKVRKRGKWSQYHV